MAAESLGTMVSLKILFVPIQVIELYPRICLVYLMGTESLATRYCCISACCYRVAHVAFKVSAYVANNLPDQIRKRVSDIERAGMDEGRATPPLQEAFRETHQSLLEQKKFDTFLSGSTCIVVLVAGEANQKRMIVANAGDCRCIVCTEGWGGKLITTQISVDQSPDRPDERKRIEKNGGIVGMVDVTLDKPVVISVEAAAKKGADLGPARVFWPDGSWEPPFDSCFPGLAMSRSLGDSVLDDLGVFPDPEVYTRAVKPKDRFLVIASDGVWQGRASIFASRG